MDTNKVTRVELKGSILNNISNAFYINLLREMLNNIITSTFDTVFSQKWVPVSGHYYTPRVGLFVEKANSYPNSGYSRSALFDIATREMSEKEVTNLFKINKADCPITNAIKASYSYRGHHYIQFESGSLIFESGESSSWRDNDCIKIATAVCSKTKFKQLVLSGKIRLEGSDYKTINDIIDFMVKKSTDIDNMDSNDLMVLAKNLKIDKTALQQTNEMIKKGIKLGVNAEEFFKNEILSCDEKRAELEKYDSKCLEDVNLGHWELWNNNLKNAVITADLTTPLIARNPVSDVHYDGIIGIDFGTKSTIVSCQNGKNKTSISSFN
ncbi:MAG: hypothetical protein PUG48_01515 [Clostridia bacterium]|nr:hypothetical protein [Clostridia bacterium]